MNEYTTPQIEANNPVPMKHSGFGVSSFVMAVTLAIFMFVLIVFAGVMESSSPNGMDEDSTEVVLLGLLIIGTILGDVLALVLGIVGIAQRSHKKVFGILGVSISAITLLLTIALMLLGMSMA